MISPETKWRFKFLFSPGMFWAGYWTALFIMSLDSPWWESLICLLFSTYNLHDHWRQVDKIMKELPR